MQRYESGQPDASKTLDSETDFVAGVVSLVTIATGLRAHINAPAGNRSFGAGGEKERVTYRFQTDLIADDVIKGDDILLDVVGESYRVAWCRKRSALGVAMLEGSCYQITGAL